MFRYSRSILFPIAIANSAPSGARSTLSSATTGSVRSSLVRKISSTTTKYAEGKITLDEHIAKIARTGVQTPSEIYQLLVSQNVINDDSFQRNVCLQLDKLNSDLVGYFPSATSSSSPSQSSSSSSIFSKFFGSSTPNQLPSTPVELGAPRVYGLYIHGNVGTGKSMLMDMFYNTSTVRNKRRVHFNRFMLDYRQREHKLKQTYHNSTGAEIREMIADQIVAESSLLCFDEFQVTDIGDAMIMKLLFEALFRRGLVIIATSNREPEKLYENGLQRQNFVPFIPMLKSQVHEVNLDSGMDYRRSETFDFNFPSWLQKSDTEKIDYHINRLYTKYGDGNVSKDRSLTVLGHKLRVPKSSGAVCEFTFDELCAEGLGEPLGAQDYLALADEFDVVIVRDVPRLDLFLMNSMIKRFIIMIDQIYDNHVGLLLVLDDHLENLYYDSDTHDRELTQEERMFMDDHKIQGVAEGVKIATLSGSEEAFAIERKISRLSEMSSEKYWAEVNDRRKDS